MRQPSPRRPRAIIRCGAVIAVAALALAGCGDNKPSGTTSPGSGSSSGTEALSGSLNIPISSADASDKAFNELNEAFRAANPGVDATVTSVPNDTIDATKAAQMTAGEADIVVISTKGFRDLPPYLGEESKTADMLLAEAGGYLDLTNEPFMANYNQSVLDSLKIGGKLYGVPGGLSYATGVYYNTQIFADNGLAVPTTWSELEQVIATLQSASVTPFGIGGGDSWPAGLIMLGVVAGLYPSAEAKEALMQGLWENTLKLDEGKQLQVLERVQTVFDATAANFAGAGYDDQPAAFAAGEFAMLPDGTWNHTTILSAVDGAFEVGYFPLPAGDTAQDNASVDGKIELTLGVNAKSKNQAAALAWLDFFSQKENYAKFVNTAGWTASQPGVEQDEFLNSITDYTADFRPVWESFWIANSNAGDAAMFPFNYPALVPLGTQTPAEAAKAAQEAW
ncbi:MAG: extracellular solute-binding protein, partial [Bifidobacteriaceae bacterium]|nr:extracellular solute-binding protein [Bifidobacteriaceae bacterium]